MILSKETQVIEESQIAEVVLGVIRGEVSIDRLSTIGIKIDSNDGLYELESGNFNTTVTPSVYDVALGLLRYSSRKRNAVRSWSFFLLAECGAIDLVAVESHPQGELLIRALWDASFEGRITSEVVAAAEAIKRDCPE